MTEPPEQINRRLCAFLCQPLDADVIDETGVEIDPFMELVQFDPLIDGVGLGYVTGADDDHLFHLFGIGHAIGTISYSIGFTLTSELKCSVD